MGVNGEALKRVEALAAAVRDDLRKLGEPSPAWPATPSGLDCDVLIVGAGQCGLAAAFGLKRAGVANLRIVSRDVAGAEGPWRTFARMPTLRSPKHAPGPELGIANLAYESWHVARYGQAAYDALDLIPTEDWAAYIDWFKTVIGVEVEQSRLMIDLAGDAAAVTARFADGGAIRARQVVLATGMDALGAPARPPPFDALPDTVCHSCYGPVDFEALAGKPVAVIGAAATGFDNAAAALEAEAKSVDLYCRPPALRTINRMKGVAAYGAVAHWADFDDATRWRFAHLGSSQTAAPIAPTVERACIWPNFRILLGAEIEAATPSDGGVTIRANGIQRRYAAVLIGTGYRIDAAARPELGHVVTAMARWRDRYTAPVELRDAALCEYPYLDNGFAFTPKTPGADDWLGRLRLFAGPAVVSMGRIVGESGNLKYGVPRLARAVTAALAEEDRTTLFETAANYDVAEITAADYAANAQPAGQPDDPESL